MPRATRAPTGQRVRLPAGVLAGVLAAALAAVLALVGCGSTTAAPPAPTVPGPTAGPASGARVVLAPGQPTTALPTVQVADLPEPAVAVLGLIAAGGPFPYQQDGSVFRNRERILPTRPEGFYREYTVPKPGEDDRGPWRIVAGSDGSRFWTEDHYASFEEVVR